MKKEKFYKQMFLAFLLIICSTGLFAQSIIVSGVVTDSDNEPIIGVSVVDKANNSHGTITDSEGRYTLSDVPSNATLQFKSIGMILQEIEVVGRTTINVVLEADTKLLDEVVVVGYGTMRKKDLTGSVGAIKGEEVAVRNTTQLSSALQGAMSGIMVTRDNNAPGAASSIRVRGITTIGDSNPLVIVDGVPGDINQVNPDDVESISVLKDAASASIYGSRAAAGVILITTKRANHTDLKLSYTAEFGKEIPTFQPEFVDIPRFLEMTNELRFNDNPAGGMYQTYTQYQIDEWIANNKISSNDYPITNWTELILKKSAPRQSHNLNISGGNKLVATNASFSYDDVDGLYGDRNYNRYGLRVNNDFTINRYLGSTLDFHFKKSNSHQPHFNPISTVRMLPHIYPAVWENGEIAEGRPGGENPYGLMKEGGVIDQNYTQISGKASLDVTPLDGLKISAVIAPVFDYNSSKSFRLRVPFTLADDPNVIGGYLAGQSTSKLTETRTNAYQITTQLISNYLKTFDRHSINLMAGYEQYHSFYENLMASRDQYILTEYPYLSIGPEAFRDNGGSAYETAYRSYFGRFMYSFADKYLFQANIRYDGSSRFAKAYRWGAFPSFSAGWVVSEESFMKNQTWLSFMKLRASYGTLGNERIGNYPYQSTISFGDVLFYQNGQVISAPTAAQVQYAIENISWETTESYNIGLDLAFLKNRLRFTGDYYKKTTKDMLLALEIPDYMGFSNPEQNTGEMYTNGYDLELNWNDRVGDFSYSASVNFSDFVSRMGDLGGTVFLGDQIKRKGSQFNEWYGYRSDGLFLTQEDLDQSPKINNNVKVGDIKYLDMGGDEETISPEYDRVLLGGSLPRYMYGGNFQAGYKGIDFSFAFQGVGKQLSRLDPVMMQPLRANYGNIPKFIDGNYWSSTKSDEENATAKYPRLTYANQTSNYGVLSDYYLFNGRYFRLKNVTLGYTIPTHLSEKLAVSKARLYASASDLFSISQYPKGWDPEMGISAYPITTTVLFGISLTF